MQQAETQASGGPAAGTKLREYETIFLVRPDLAEDLVDKIVERMRGIVQRDGGKVIKVENWGKKKTSYEVKKHLRAVYLRFDYLGTTRMVAEFERNLRMTDDVLKYQSVKMAEDVDPATRQVEPDVKLPGDPEVPERGAREPEAFGAEERGFGDRDRDRGRDRDLPDEAAVEPDTE
jgi:small subunit ribosomal protein S6